MRQVILSFNPIDVLYLVYSILCANKIVSKVCQKKLLTAFKETASGLTPNIKKKNITQNYFRKIQLQFATNKIEVDPLGRALQPLKVAIG